MAEYFFAWVDGTETTFGPEHEVEDEKIFSARVEQNEKEFAALTIEIKNPRVGLLAPGRKVHAWFSWNSGGSTAGAEPLFFGRLVAIPSDLFAEVITLEFHAQPADFLALKTALAESLKVLPFYDPVFIDEQFRDDPETVLLGYSKLWHIDRITHAVTVSDIISGEDALEEFSSDEVPYDSVKLTLESPPFTSVDVEMTVNWTQSFAGAIDIGSQSIKTYTGDGLISDWPQPGSSLAGGWSVVNSSAVDVRGIGNTHVASWSRQWQNKAKTHANGDFLSESESSSKPILRGPYLSTVLTDKGQVGLNDPFADPPINVPATRQTTSLFVPEWLVATTLSLTYESDRKRSELLKFTLVSDLQAVLTDSADEQRADDPIKLNGADVAVPIPDDSTAGSTAPIGDAARRSYFPTDRGLRSLEYGISVARAKLLKAARAGQLSWDISFERAINLSCRKNALLNDERLPGGSALGKIIGYQFEVNGDERRADGSVTVASAIGFGNAIIAVAGTPDYVDDDYVEPDYQHYSGDTILASAAGDIGYSTPVDVPDDDGLVFPLTRAQAVISESITGSLAAQAAAIHASFLSEIQIANLGATPSVSDQVSLAVQELIAKASVNSTANALKNNPIAYNLELVNLTGKSFATNYEVNLTKLAIPKQLDLESSGNEIPAGTLILNGKILTLNGKILTLNSGA